LIQYYDVNTVRWTNQILHTPNSLQTRKRWKHARYNIWMVWDTRHPL